MKVFELYMDTNVRPKYVRQKYIIDFTTLTSILPSFSLVDDLKHAFCKRIADQVEAEKLLLDDSAKRKDTSTPDREYTYSFLPIKIAECDLPEMQRKQALLKEAISLANE